MKNLTLTSTCFFLFFTLAALATVTLANLRLYRSRPVYYYTYYSSSAKSISPYRTSAVLYTHPSPIIRTLARSYRLADSIDKKPKSVQPAAVILLNETSAVPFTTSNSALSSTEYEANPSAPYEEGVGPATSFEPSQVVIKTLPSGTSKVQYISSKTGSSKSDKAGGKGKNKNSVYEPQVVYSDVHPVYVKPPVDFKPVVYPNRRLDGIRSGQRFSNQVTLVAPIGPYPYPFPRGISSWTFGGASAFNRGSYWESLGSDEALQLNSGSSSSGNNNNNNNNNKSSKKKGLVNGVTVSATSKLNPSFVPWVIYPSGNTAAGASVYQLPSSYQIQYHHSPSYSLWPESTVHFSTSSINSPSASSSSSSKSKKPSTGPTRLSSSGSRRVNSTPSNIKPLTSQTVKSPSFTSSSSSSSSSIFPSSSSSSSFSSSSLDGQKTKLPVGLTSWFLGGVRDLSGKHWKLPELTVNGVDVVPLNASPDASLPPLPGTSSVASSSETTPKDLMMTSDGEYEKVEPSVVDSTSIETTEKESQPSVTFDDDSDFVNTLS